jgi:hypothetical protein
MVGSGCRARRRPGTAEVSEREMAQWRRQPLPAAAKLAICWEHIASLGALAESGEDPQVFNMMNDKYSYY